MLSWIKGGTSDHPLDSQDARDSLQADLARMSPVMALSQLATYLNDVKTAKNLRPARALEIIDLLDRMGGPLQRKLTRDHLAPREPLTKFHENRIWTAVYTYARELADVYRLCLAQYQVGAAGSAVLKRRLPQITCRALRACATQLKWMLLRYGPVEQRLWQELCGLYRLSESLGFAQVNCAMYPQIDSTPEREFLRAAVLAVSSPDGLTPLQIDIAERVIEKVAHGFRVNQRPSSGISYVVELSGEHGPGRLSTNLKLTQDLRCFGPAGAAAEIERAVQFMDQHRASPPDLAIGEDLNVSAVHATLTHLQRYWSAVLPERRDRRRRQLERVSVVHEFEEVVAAVGGLFLESPFVSNEEEWNIENESESGFGAFVQSPQGAWLEIGTLIAIRRDEGAAWSAAIVRRVSMDEAGNRYVGIEILAHGGTAVTIMAASLSARGSAIPPQGEICVLLPSSTVNTGEALLLMRPEFFSHSRSLLMSVYDRRYCLSPLGMVEHRAEFDLGRYRIVEHMEESAKVFTCTG
jgi:hypothetical protein